jgi:predicted transcriptional regulator
VRDQGMDLTGWLEFFVDGLATQLSEVKARGEQVIRRDVLVNQHGLNERQALAVEHLLKTGRLDIRAFEELRPEVARRTLQRDLADLESKGLITSEGETNHLIYKLKGGP